MIDLLGKTIELKAQSDAKLVEQIGTMAAGLVSANQNAHDVTLAVLERLPELAEATRPSARQLVAPIGESCTSMTQFAKTDAASEITESEAEVIRGGAEMEVDPMQSFKINQITELNIRTGHCVVMLDNGAPVSGKITDPALEQPGNVYTSAMNNHSPLMVQAKAVRKAGHLYRLYISNTP